MQDHINEPENQPKLGIEKLISQGNSDVDKRVHERLKVESGNEVLFSIVCRGEVQDISEQGISIRFTPSESPSLEDGASLEILIDLENRTYSAPAVVRRVESRFGVIVMGMQFDPDELEIRE